MDGDGGDDIALLKKSGKISALEGRIAENPLGLAMESVLGKWKDGSVR